MAWVFHQEDKMKARITWGVAMIGLAMLLTATALAQVGRIEGDVKKQGSGEPITNATIQIVRMDIKGNYDVPTDKKGQFLHAGVPYTGTYTLLVSAPECSPTYLTGIRPTGELLKIELAPGDGKKITIDEVRAQAAQAKSSGGGAAPAAAKQPSAEEVKKQQAEFEKKKAEIEKQKSDFENMKKSFEEGRVLASNKDYSGAITKFTEAEKLDADQHVVPANLALALYNRGATKLNAGERDPAKQDFTDSVAAATRALTIVEPTLADPAKAVEGKKNKLSYLKIRADAESVLAKRFGNAEAAQAAVADYKAAATLSEVPEEKKSFNVKGAQTLFDAGLTDKAVPAFQEILQTDPDNIEALYSLGLAYVGISNFQEAANTLQKFVDRAPESDPRVAEAKMVMKDLIVGNNLQAPKADSGARSRATRAKKP
jgi:tetratricopeptide (TPR) repeat protein